MDLSGVLAKFRPELRSQLTSLLAAPDFHGVISAADAQKLAHAMGSDVYQLMLALLPLVAESARPAISHYKVGAVAMGLAGNLYFGMNMEFLGKSLIYTVHAEQAAVVNAWLNQETGLTALAVSAAPCGYCRQFLWELATAGKLKIYLPGKSPRMLADYLPDAFGPGDLGVTGGLLSPQNNHLVLDQPSEDPVILAALQAANRSYAPYTSLVNPNRGKACYAGVALATADRRLFTGSYGENAAYNPAILPMQAALVAMNLHRSYFTPITKAVLVQGHGLGQDGGNPTCDQQLVSRDVLQAVSGTPLTVVLGHQRL